jgi:uncharacterized protein YaaN involved in tellurite resistance
MASPVVATPFSAPPVVRRSGDVVDAAAPEVDATLAKSLATRLVGGSPAEIIAFGAELTSQSAVQTDDILKQVRAGEMDAIGAKLSEVLGVAQTLNVKSLARGRSRLPVIGPVVDFFLIRRDAIVRQFQSVSTQIDTLLGEIRTMQEALATRVDSLEAHFESVRTEHGLLATHVAAGQQALEKLRPRVAALATASGTPLEKQAAQDLAMAVRNLEKRVADLQVLQHAALQQLPMIRIVQANNRALVEKFQTIRDLTVPSWKRQFVLALALSEQQSAVDLAEEVDAATNAFLRENAKLLKTNTVRTARANQRLVIDVETLKEVHESLVSTVQEVARISAEGREQRVRLTGELGQLRATMAAELGRA